MVNDMTKKTKKVENVDDKEIRMYVAGEVKENKEIVEDLSGDVKWVKSGAEKSFGKPRKILGCMCPEERLLTIAGKSNLRGGACKVLIDKGEIGREEYKKFNRHGDVRFLREFVDEQLREGKIYYVLKNELRIKLKGKR